MSSSVYTGHGTGGRGPRLPIANPSIHVAAEQDLFHLDTGSPGVPALIRERLATERPHPNEVVPVLDAAGNQRGFLDTRAVRAAANAIMYDAGAFSSPDAASAASRTKQRSQTLVGGLGVTIFLPLTDANGIPLGTNCHAIKVVHGRQLTQISDERERINAFASHAATEFTGAMNAARLTSKGEFANVFIPTMGVIKHPQLVLRPRLFNTGEQLKDINQATVGVAVIMDRMRGSTMEERIRKHGAQPLSMGKLRRNLNYLMQASHGMAKLHAGSTIDDQNSYIHGDIKPSNIMIDDHDASSHPRGIGRACFIDSSTLITVDGAGACDRENPMVTAGYGLNDERASYAADVYSMGMTILATLHHVTETTMAAQSEQRSHFDSYAMRLPQLFSQYAARGSKPGMPPLAHDQGVIELVTRVKQSIIVDPQQRCSAAELTHALRRAHAAVESRCDPKAFHAPSHMDL